jgi:hypothetical protein
MTAPAHQNRFLMALPLYQQMRKNSKTIQNSKSTVMKNSIIPTLFAIFSMLTFNANAQASSNSNIQPWNSGSMTTTLINNVKAWDWIEWKQSPTEFNSAAAKGYLSVEAVDANGERQMVISELYSADTTIAGINASEYPGLSITWYSEDANSIVAPKLEYIRVLAEAAGEFAFRPDMYVNGYKDTVNQNETYQFSVMIQNVAAVDMDSLEVKYYTEVSSPRYMKVKALAAGETLILPIISVETEGMSGAQNLIVELNPNRSQTELSYANNQIIVPFFVAEEAAVVATSEEAADIQSEIYNFPNPVRDLTNFQINLGNNYSQTENIQINIYDLKGQQVKSINANNNNGQGSFSQSWNAADESGNVLSAGIYFYKVIAQDNSGKMNSISAKSNIQIVR